MSMAIGRYPSRIELSFQLSIEVINEHPEILFQPAGMFLILRRNYPIMRLEIYSRLSVNEMK